MAVEVENEKGGELKVTLVFSGKSAKAVRHQAKANYLPITQYLKQLVLKALDTAD